MLLSSYERDSHSCLVLGPTFWRQRPYFEIEAPPLEASPATSERLSKALSRS